MCHFHLEYKPLNIVVNIQWILTWNDSCHNVPIQNFWCDLWYKSKTTWLTDKNAISHLVDMAKGCHSAVGLMGYCVFIHQPWGLAIGHLCTPTSPPSSWPFFALALSIFQPPHRSTTIQFWVQSYIIDPQSVLVICECQRLTICPAHLDLYDDTK